jgi:hypothetical protein
MYKKEQLLESLVKEVEAAFSDLAAGGEPIILNKEEDTLEDEADKLIAEVLVRFRII